MGDWDFSIYNYLLLLSAGIFILIVSLFLKKNRPLFKLFLLCAVLMIAVSLILIIKWKLMMDERDKRRDERGAIHFIEKRITQV